MRMRMWYRWYSFIAALRVTGHGSRVTGPMMRIPSLMLRCRSSYSVSLQKGLFTSDSSAIPTKNIMSTMSLAVSCSIPVPQNALRHSIRKVTAGTPSSGLVYHPIVRLYGPSARHPVVARGLGGEHSCDEMMVAFI